MQKSTKNSRANRAMSGIIEKKQNAKDAQHQIHGKAKKNQRNTAKDITRIANEASCKRSKNFRHQSFLTVFFLKKNLNIFIG